MPRRTSEKASGEVGTPNFTAVVQAKLQWASPQMRTQPRYAIRTMRRRHEALAPLRPQLIERAGALLREHNRMDVELYAWVHTRFSEDALAAAR